MPKSLEKLTHNLMNAVRSQRQNADKIERGEMTEDDVFLLAVEQACKVRGRAVPRGIERRSTI